MRKLLTILFLFSFLSGCSGKLYTIINPDLPADGETKKIRGIVVYNSVNVIEIYQNRILVDESSGNQIGTADTGECNPVYISKFSTRTDYSNPSVIVYEPGPFETNKFGVTLESGVLKSVNTESDPTKALKDIASLMPYVAAEKSYFIGKKFCNAGAKLVGVYKAPDILPYDQRP